MTTVGGDEPKVTVPTLTQAEEVPASVPPHEPSSSPLTTHAWTLRAEIPVRDFGRYGISAYTCSRCGLDADSDPMTGYVRCSEPCTGRTREKE